MGELRLRPAARAIVLAPDDRVLLVRFQLSDRSVWATPGGGLEPGEDHRQAIRRELAEETGLIDVGAMHHVWSRTHVVPIRGGRWDGQTERYYLVRTPVFEPQPLMSWSELRAENVTTIRWWTQEQLDASDALFAPSRLVPLLDDLLAHGPPTEPLEIGV